MSEAKETNLSVGAEIPVSRTKRAIYLARTALAPVVGTGVAVGSAYLGYRFSSEAVSQSSLGDIADRITVIGGAIVGGGFGALAGIEIAPAIAGDKPQPIKPEAPEKPKEKDEAPTPTETPQAEPEAATDTPQGNLDAIAQAVNDGSLKQEIDAANNDPDLAV